MFRNVMTYLGLGPDEEYDDGYLYADDDASEAEPARAARSQGHVTSVPPSRQSAGRGSDGYEEEIPGAVTAVRPLRPVSNNTSDEPRDHESMGSGFTGRTSARSGGRFDLENAAPDASGHYGGSGQQNSSVQRTQTGQRNSSNERPSSGDRPGGDRHRNEPVVRPVPIQRTKPRALSPQTFADAKVLADDIKASVPVIMNLRGVDRDLARRLIDFASGVCYSLDASMEKLASQVFLLTPEAVEVSGEERRRIEERGFDH